MSPLADGADLAAPAEEAGPASLLQDGEVIILMIRPSGWFVLLTAWPMLAAAACVALTAWAAGMYLFPDTLHPRTVVLVCMLAAAIRVLAGCFQWTSRLYVLTNRRAMRFRGALHPSVEELPLRNVVQTHLSAWRLERMLGVASLVFELTEGKHRTASWVHIGRAEEVKQIVDQTIRRTR